MNSLFKWICNFTVSLLLFMMRGFLLQRILKTSREIVTFDLMKKLWDRFNCHKNFRLSEDQCSPHLEGFRQMTSSRHVINVLHTWKVSDRWHHRVTLINVLHTWKVSDRWRHCVMWSMFSTPGRFQTDDVIASRDQCSPHLEGFRQMTSSRHVINVLHTWKVSNRWRHRITWSDDTVSLSILILLEMTVDLLRLSHFWQWTWCVYLVSDSEHVAV